MVRMNNEKWYPLETSAQIYPAIVSPRQPSVFRLSCTFEKEIDPSILQTALNVTMTRFPSFAMTLKRGLSGSILRNWRKHRCSGPKKKAPA